MGNRTEDVFAKKVAKSGAATDGLHGPTARRKTNCSDDRADAPVAMRVFRNESEDYALLPSGGFPAARLILAARLTSRLRGLLLSPESDAVLMLTPCHDIHTFGMGYAIDVAFVDESGMVLQSKRDVLPNRRLRNVRASAVLERFAMPREVWFEEGDRLEIGAFRTPGAAEDRLGRGAR